MMPGSEEEYARSEEYEEQMDKDIDDRTAEVEMSAEDYHALPGLSNSGLGDFMESPLYYWHKHIQPGREAEEPTPHLLLGQATHCAVLEPKELYKRYCRKFEAPDGCLKTVADLRAHASKFEEKLKGALKSDLIEQLKEYDPDVPIFDELAAEYDADNADKVQFKHDAWVNILGAAKALRDEPKLQDILSDRTRKEEHKFTVKYNGLMLRSMMDLTTDDVTLDLKTISRKRGEDFGRTVTRAIWYEGYYRQAYFYSLVRSIAAGDDPPNAQNAPRFIFAFVESSAPYETRIRELKPKVLGEVNLLWERARIEVESAIELYRTYVDRFGEKQWRYAQDVEPLMDEEFPQVTFGR